MYPRVTLPVFNRDVCLSFPSFRPLFHLLLHHSCPFYTHTPHFSRVPTRLSLRCFNPHSLSVPVTFSPPLYVFLSSHCCISAEVSVDSSCTVSQHFVTLHWPYRSSSLPHICPSFATLPGPNQPAHHG